MPPRGYLQALIKLLKVDCLAIALCPTQSTDAATDTKTGPYTLDMKDIELLERAEALLSLTDLDGTGRNFMDVVALTLLKSVETGSGNSNRTSDSDNTATMPDQTSAVSVERHPIRSQMHCLTCHSLTAYLSFRPTRYN